jgi:hypothetical protein
MSPQERVFDIYRNPKERNLADYTLGQRPASAVLANVSMA